MGDELGADVRVIDDEELPWLEAEGGRCEGEGFFEIGPDGGIDFSGGVELFDGVAPVEGVEDGGGRGAGHGRLEFREVGCGRAQKAR